MRASCRRRAGAARRARAFAATRSSSSAFTCSRGRSSSASSRAAASGGVSSMRRDDRADALELVRRDVDAVQPGEDADDVAHRREHVLVEDDQVAAVAAHPVVDPARRELQVRLDHRAAERVGVVEHARADRLVALLAEEDDRLLDAAEDVEARRVRVLAREDAVDQLVEPAEPHVRDVGLDRAEAVLLEAGVAGVVLDPREPLAVLRRARRLEPVAVDLVPVDERVDVRPAVGDALRDRAAEDGDLGAFGVGRDVGAGEFAPSNRFILRSAVRLYVHLDEPDTAHRVLSDSASTPVDPWLVAAEIAVCTLLGRRSRLIKRGRDMLISGHHSTRDTAELASALGTIELEADASKRARRLFGSSLDDPTDNAVAQAVWATRTLKISKSISRWSSCRLHLKHALDS